jgi:hypothetical protein
LLSTDIAKFTPKVNKQEIISRCEKNIFTNNILSVVVQEQSKKYKNLKMSFLRATFEKDYTVDLIFTLILPNCSVKRDEKHNQ